MASQINTNCKSLHRIVRLYNCRGCNLRYSVIDLPAITVNDDSHPRQWELEVLPDIPSPILAVEVH